MKLRLPVLLVLIALTFGCSNSTVPGDEPPSQPVDLEEAQDAEMTEEEALIQELAADDTLSLSLGITPADPSEPQVLSVSLFATDRRMEPIGRHEDGSPAEARRVLNEAERQGLMKALAAAGFFEAASEAYSERVPEPTAEPPAADRYEPTMEGVLRITVTTHDDQWYLYRFLAIDDVDEAVAFLTTLEGGASHDTAIHLYGLADALRE